MQNDTHTPAQQAARAIFGPTNGGIWLSEDECAKIIQFYCGDNDNERFKAVVYEMDSDQFIEMPEDIGQARQFIDEIILGKNILHEETEANAPQKNNVPPKG